MDLAEASEEGKLLQPANAEVRSRTESLNHKQKHRQHNRIEYCLLRLYERAEA